MELFKRRLPRRENADVMGRLAAVEDYVEYLRQQGESGYDKTTRRIDALAGDGRSEENGGSQ